MEINKYTDIMGVKTTEAIVEGRMVLLTENTAGTQNFGSEGDLAGVKLPDTTAEAGQARYVLAFSVDNRQTPIFQPTPSFEWAMRHGWEQAENVPFDTTVHLTYPGNKLGSTVPSGVKALAFDRGVFTVLSGNYIHDPNLEVPGARLAVANTADDSAADAGKLKYDASGNIAVTERFNSETGALTFRTL